MTKTSFGSLVVLSVLPWLAVACREGGVVNLGEGTLAASNHAAPDAAAALASISCPYHWEPSPAAPLDVCCHVPEPSTLPPPGPLLGSEPCAAFARGDRPYECTPTADGCGCAYGVGGHRYTLGCTDRGCECTADGWTFAAGSGDRSSCGDLDTVWATACGFPTPDAATGATPCPAGFTLVGGNSCCRGNGDQQDCVAPTVDTPFSCTTGKGTGCSLVQDGHAYGMKCDTISCICSLDGVQTSGTPILDAAAFDAKTVWNDTCGFPPE
jgi:hypothetical protein